MSHGSQGGQSGAVPVHVAPLRQLFANWAALVFLTIVTYTLGNIRLGEFNLWIAIGIAGFKVLLVALFFMHLVHDRPFNGILIGGSVVFVTLFIIFALSDTFEYQSTLDQGPAPAVRNR